MPLLKPDLLTIYTDPSKFTFYYGGGGNFTQNKLKYSKDQPGGQWSGEPYIKWPLPNFASPTVLAYYADNRASLDFPGRGTQLNYDFQTGLVVSNSATYDKQRINYFLKSSPKGNTFITKQIGLQLTNPKIEVGVQANLSPGSTPGRFFGEIEATRIYNGGKNTLVQVGYQGSGVHADRHGVTPFNPISQTYEKVVESYNQKEANGVKGSNNRLVTLLTSKIYGNTDFQDQSNRTRLGIPRNQNLLFQYLGGPGSAYGIGLTTIPRFQNGNRLYFENIPNRLYDPIEKKPVALQSILSNFKQQQKSTISFTNTPGYFSFINNENSPGYKGKLLTDLKDKLLVVNSSDTTITKYTLGNDGSSPIQINRVENTAVATDTLKNPQTTANAGVLAFNYKLLAERDEVNRTGKIGEDFRRTLNQSRGPAFSSTGASFAVPNLPTADYSVDAQIRRGDIPSKSQDPVNMLDVGQDSSQDIDLIPFKFEAVEYDLKEGTFLVFRAYLTSLQDNNTGEYSSFRYTGRGENFYTYNGFTRNISFNFKIAVLSKREMKPLYRKLNYLVSQTYPDYGDKGYMRSPLVKITIGDYIVAQPGFLQSVNLTIPNDSPWEINEDEDVYKLPHFIDVSCQFTPIHNFLPERGYKIPDSKHYIPAFITPGAGNGIVANSFGIGTAVG